MNNGIWKYSKKYCPEIEEKFRLSLDEGETKINISDSLSKEVGVDELLFKREDLNPNGSHKDRMIAYQLSAHIQDGATDFVISSSGNAAISASQYCKLAGVNLTVYISPDTPKGKLDLIDSTAKVVKSKKAKSDAFKFAKEHGAVLLRGSTDPYALEGLKSIAFELSEQVPDATDIFVPVSSGTCAQAIYDGYKMLEGDIPRLHIVQSSRVNTIAKEFDEDFISTDKSIVQAIVDRVGHRKDALVKAVKQSGGFGWVVMDEAIEEARRMLVSEKIDCANEGAMAFVALIKAMDFGWEIEKPVIIITGRFR